MNKAEKIFEFFKDLYNIGLSVYKERVNIENTKSGVNIELKRLEEMFEEIMKMSGNIENISKKLEENLSTIYERLPNYIKYYEEEIKKLNEILILLDKSTMYTDNLLSEIHHIEIVSRNAEIKAYHLGEKGKGLSVVSQELSKLASRIISNAEKISKHIEEIKGKYSVFKEKHNRIYNQVNRIRNYEEDLINVLSSLEKAIKDFTFLSGRMREIYAERRRLLDSLFRNLVDIEAFGFSFFIDSEKVLIFSNIFESNEEVLNALYETYEEIKHAPFYIKNRLIEKIRFFSENNLNILEELNKKFSSFEKVKEEWDLKMRNILNLFNKVELQEKEIKIVGQRMIKTLKESISYYVDEVRNLNKILKDFSKEINANEDLPFVSVDPEFLKLLRLLRDDLKDGEILSLYSSVETARAGVIEDPLSKELKERVRNSIHLSEEVIKASNEIIKISSSTESIIQDSETEHKIYLEVEEDVEKLNKFFTDIKDFIEVLQRDIEGFRKNFEFIERFVKEISIKFARTESYMEEIKEVLGKLRKEVNLRIPKKEEVKEVEIKEITLNLPLTSSPANLNPYLATDATSNTILENIHRALFMVSPKSSKVVPMLIDNFEIGKDGTLYTFVLKKNIKFHNGEFLNAYDVRDSLFRTLRGNARNYFEMIRGAKDFIKRKTSSVEGIKILDDYRIEIELEYPYVPFINNLALCAASITKEENGKLYGLGPFILEKYEKDKFVELRAFNDYFAGRACVDRVVFRIERAGGKHVEMFLNGELDLLEPSSKDEEVLRERAPHYLDKIQSVPEISIQRFDFNITKYPFTDVHFRRALNYALDKEGFIRERFKNRAIKAEGIFPPSSEVYNESLKGYEFDLEKARRELSKSSVKPPLKVKLTITDSEAYRKNAKFIENCFKKLGVEFEIEEKPWKEFLDDLHNGRTECHMIGWIGDTGDPDSIAYPLFHSSSMESGANEMRYSNPVIDKMLDEARRIRIPEERKKLYQEIEKKILEDAPCIFLYHPYQFILLSEKVKGIWPHPLGHFRIEIAVKLP